MQTRYKVQTTDWVQNADWEFIPFFSSSAWKRVALPLTERHAIAFPRSSCTIICTIVEYSLPVSGSQYILLALSRLMWCLYRIYQLIKSRCRCKLDATIWETVTIDSFARVRTFHLFNRYVFILLTKMRTDTKTVPSTWYIFNVQGCTHIDFHICALYHYWHEESANFYGEKWSVAFVTSH